MNENPRAASVVACRMSLFNVDWTNVVGIVGIVAKICSDLVRLCMCSASPCTVLLPADGVLCCIKLVTSCL
jgi:hypothetical protein